MERTRPANQTKQYPSRLPDIIINNVHDNFTLVPNSAIRSPEMSWKAKGLLSLLLSNKDDEWYSYKETIKKFGNEGEESIRSGLKELENNGYLLRLKYRDRSPKEKKIRGSIWICTPYANQFDWDTIKHRLAKHGLEPVPDKENPQLGFLKMGDPEAGNPDAGSPTFGVTPTRGHMGLIIRNSKKTNFNKIDNHCSKSNLADEKSPTQKRTENFLPQAEKLAKTVQSTKRVNVPPSKVKSWADEIRKINEIEGVELSRIDAVLDWYFYHIGGEFIPVVESGYSLREKFIRLEAAMERNNGNGSKKPDPSGSRLPSRTRKYHARSQ